MWLFPWGIKKKLKKELCRDIVGKVDEGGQVLPSIVFTLSQWHGPTKRFPSYSKNIWLFLLVIFIESHMNYQTLLLSARGNRIFSYRGSTQKHTYPFWPNNVNLHLLHVLYFTHQNGSSVFLFFSMPS